jgi:hypothetical protein
MYIYSSYVIYVIIILGIAIPWWSSTLDQHLA